MTMRLFAFVAVLLTGSSLATARPPDPCPLTSTVTDAKVKPGDVLVVPQTMY